jgi:hypothetical protein
MKKSIFVVVATIALTLSLAGCKESVQTAAEKADAANKQAQNDVKARATQAVPVPHISNFQARKNIEEYLNRLDEPNKVWYVYERAPLSGEILGYYTSSSYPQSVCTFMTQPEEVEEVSVAGPNPISTTTAMALDGVYYKGGSCPDFFFDYNTGAMIVLDEDAVTIAVDQPLDVGAPSFSFKGAE